MNFKTRFPDLAQFINIDRPKEMEYNLLYDHDFDGEQKFRVQILGLKPNF